MRSSIILSFLLFGINSLCVQFSNPPAAGQLNDFSLNAAYVQGSTIEIQWSPTNQGNPLALTMFQQNATTFLQPFEYIAQNMLANSTSFSWIVGTTKDLTVSNMFFFCLFVEGENSAAANSHYFNITAKSGTQQTVGSSTTSSVKSSSTSSSATTASSTNSEIFPTSISTTNSTTSASTDPTATLSVSESNKGLSTGDKFGVGIGVVGAIAIGIIAGRCIFGRRKQHNQIQDVDLPVAEFHKHTHVEAGNSERRSQRLFELHASYHQK